MSSPSVRETITKFLLECAKNYGHTPTEMMVPKPLADRLMTEVMMKFKEPEGPCFPISDFKLAMPTGILTIRVNK